MKIVFTILFLCMFAVLLPAQKPDEVLATAAGLTFNQAALSENGRKIYLGQDKIVASERTKLLSEMIMELLLESEAKTMGATSEAVIAAELKKAPAPAEAEIKAVFDANKANFGERTVNEVRTQIVTFLRQGARQKAVRDLADSLKLKYKFATGKDINAIDLKATDAVFSIGGKTVTAREFDESHKAALYDVRAEIAEEIRFDLENSVFSALVGQEAKSRNMEAGDLIAAEVTNKLREFSDEERAGLETSFRKQLFEKYKIKMLVSTPEPIAHDVSIDDDPSSGKPTAPVTVIMFSDFQCSACAATHPILKKVMGEYGDKVRFVVRDFPLESIHENAFRAALAANAARAQGKFFEYTDILYRNQDNLDEASLKKYAADLGLNIKQFELDFTSEKTGAEVRKDIADGSNYGIDGTPTIYVNGVKVNRLGAEAFRNAIDRALAKPVVK